MGIYQECIVDIVADTIIGFQGRKLPQSRGGGGGLMQPGADSHLTLLYVQIHKGNHHVRNVTKPWTSSFGGLNTCFYFEGVYTVL